MATDTIVAIATPPGRGGVGVVRLSGKNALTIAQEITRTSKRFQPRYAHFMSFYKADEQDKNPIDTGLLIYFKAPHSFTGEDVVEFQGHGAPFVLDSLIDACIKRGARLAKPGEFSERAFLNDKIDLAQAEAIADLIHANSTAAARLAMRSLEGDFSKRITVINEQLIRLRLFAEAAIDFSDEDIDFIEREELGVALDAVRQDLDSLCKGAHQGALLRESSVVVIAGPPNAGKSTLLNALSGLDIAIVHDEAGTTRDIMREQVLIDDIPLQLIDTAGLRESEHLVEQEGIRRAWDAIQRADVVLTVFDVQKVNKDCGSALDDEIKAALPSHIPVIRVHNKIDMLDTEKKTIPSSETVYLSAKNKAGLDVLKEKIKQALGHEPTEGLFLARRRHMDALNRARESLQQGITAFLSTKQAELLAEDLRQAHDELSQITGKFTSEDLLGEIFSTFCIGK